MNEYLSKDKSLETLLKPNDLWLINEQEPYILKHIDNIRLSSSQYIATSIINDCPYIDNMFALEEFDNNVWKQLVNIINLNPSQD